MGLPHRYVCIGRNIVYLGFGTIRVFRHPRWGRGVLGRVPADMGGGGGGLLYLTEWLSFPLGGSRFVIPALVLLFWNGRIHAL